MQCCIAFVRRGTSVLPSSTARARLLSLVRFGTAPAEPVNTLEKGWAAYRKQNWRLASIRVQIQAEGRYLGCMQQNQRTQFDRQASCERKSKRSWQQDALTFRVAEECFGLWEAALNAAGPRDLDLFRVPLIRLL